jgi:energy-coupling factor transporter transmembrane protein EcfT
MKIIKTILDRPYLVIFIAFIIALVIPDSYSFYSLAMVCLIFITSIIYTIIEKKWLRLFLSFLGFFAFLLAWMSFIFLKGFNDELTPIVKIGDEKFYSNEILKSSDLRIPNGLKIISKLDSIIYVGIENEYDAECIYTGPSKLITELENDIISNKDFSKVDQLENYPTRVISQYNFNLKELKSVYKKESEGSFIIYFAFDKSNAKVYYSANYY